jgi:hypothetical protein
VWIPATAVVRTTAVLCPFDPTEASYFHRTSKFNGFNNILIKRGRPAAILEPGNRRRNSGMVLWCWTVKQAV